MKDNERKVSFEHKEQIIVQQHFWFTITMLSINGFLISSHNNVSYSLYTLIWISFLNLYAIYLIISRAASYADKIHFPEKITKVPQSERTYKEKAMETTIRLKATLRHIPFMIFELSSSLFYSLLVLTSYVAFITICKF